MGERFVESWTGTRKCFDPKKVDASFLSLLPHYRPQPQTTLNDTLYHSKTMEVDIGRIKSGEVNLGTSIMAVQFKDGVIIGADSRTTTGSYIVSFRGRRSQRLN